jgi:NAD(P)H-nitrite reductase large subunit
MKHLIIGAGPAGITAAKTIRSLRPDDKVVILTEDTHIISRVMLHKYINGERDLDGLSFVEENFLEKNKIEWVGGQKVTGLDPAAKTVTTDSQSYSYDKLLIAPGARATIPPICILEAVNNLYGFRHLGDAKAIREAAATSEKVVVIGAGLVGMAVVEPLLAMGKDVTVVEFGQGILSLNLDEHAARAYQSKFEEAGCKFYLNQGVTDTHVNEKGNITTVILGDGTQLSCDFVVAATGAKPEVGFLKDSGITYDRGLTVDQHLATNFPDVYGAGDVTGLSGIWPNAMRQGEVAGKNMAGETTVYEDSFAVKNTIHFYDLVTLTIGLTKPEDGDIVEVHEDRRGYRKLIIRDGRIVGLILQGDISNSGFWQYLIKNNIQVDNLNKPIWKVTFADFVSLNDDGEYLWVKE